jgi:predicted kinase
MKKAIITIGISGSGKSTEFDKKENMGYVRIERDIMRKRIVQERMGDVSDQNFWSIWKFNKKDEAEVTDRCNAIIEDCAKGGMPIAITDTNLNKKYRDVLVQKLKGLGYEVEFKVFSIDPLEAIKRDEKRRDSVGHQVIWKQYNDLMADPEFGQTKKYVADVSKPKCILVDIDGTLAHMNGKRGAFEWDKVGLDDVDEQVRNIVEMFHASPESDVKVIVLSGRDGVSRPKTEAWLDDHGIGYYHLFMRSAGDMRKDTVIKEEIFWRDIAPNHNVQFAIDDRPSVCRMWRSLGVKVFQVGNPHVEF